MASKLSFPNTVSTGSCESTGSSKTMSNTPPPPPPYSTCTFKCFDCCRTFPNLIAQIKHRSENGSCRQMRNKSMTDHHKNAATNATRGSGYLKRYHPYTRKEALTIGAAADDHEFHDSSPEYRTLDLISQLDPTQNFLCLIENQSSGENVADGAASPSEEKGPVDVNLKLGF